MKNNTLGTCICAAGTALFVVLSSALKIPVFENYYLCLGYAVVAVYCYCFGPSFGITVGVLGTAAYCFLINGLRGLPGWALGNAVIGLMLGLVFRKTSKMDGFRGMILEITAIILSATLGILIVKSFTECLLYSQPMALRMGKNFYAWIADIFVLIVSLPLCRVLYRRLKKMLRPHARHETT